MEFTITNSLEGVLYSSLRTPISIDGFGYRFRGFRPVMVGGLYLDPD